MPAAFQEMRNAARSRDHIWRQPIAAIKIGATRVAIIIEEVTLSRGWHFDANTSSCAAIAMRAHVRYACRFAGWLREDGLSRSTQHARR